MSRVRSIISDFHSMAYRQTEGVQIGIPVSPTLRTQYRGIAGCIYSCHSDVPVAYIHQDVKVYTVHITELVETTDSTDSFLLELGPCKCHIAYKTYSR